MHLKLVFPCVSLALGLNTPQHAFAPHPGTWHILACLSSWLVLACLTCLGIFYHMLVLPGIPWHTLALPNCHALINSFTIFATWEPNQVIDKTMLCATQSLPLSKTALTNPL